MWPIYHVVHGCKNFSVQEQKALNWMLQVNYADFERKIMVNYLRELKMITLSNGVEISEDTVVSALKKAGINVEPKHIFKTGDVAESEYGGWRLIVKIDSELVSIDESGYEQSKNQAQFEDNGYKYVGKLIDLVNNS